MSLHTMHSVAGVVEEISDAVAGQTGLKKGDPVMALVGGGGYAGQHYIHLRLIALSRLDTLCLKLQSTLQCLTRQ